MHTSLPEFVILYSSPWHLVAPSLSLSLSTDVRLCRVMTYITDAGSCQGHKSDGCDLSLYVCVCVSMSGAVCRQSGLKMYSRTHTQAPRGLAAAQVTESIFKRRFLSHQTTDTHTRADAHTFKHICTHSSSVPSGSNKTGCANSEPLVLRLLEAFVYKSTQALP